MAVRPVEEPRRSSGVSAGWAGVAIGLVGIFVLSFALSPLAILFGLVALLRFQIFTGLLALVFGAIGVVTSPVLMGVVGLSAIAILSV